MTVVIHKVREPFGRLGNMSPDPIFFNGEEWHTAEALFQALRFGDAWVRDTLRQEKNPMKAKMFAKKNRSKFIVEPRSHSDVENMRAILKLKTEQHPDILEELLGTGDEQIVEDCTKRASESGLFWGACLEEGEWVGTNMLGKLWMELRTPLLKAEWSVGFKDRGLGHGDFGIIRKDTEALVIGNVSEEVAVHIVKAHNLMRKTS